MFSPSIGNHLNLVVPTRIYLSILLNRLISALLYNLTLSRFNCFQSKYFMGIRLSWQDKLYNFKRSIPIFVMAALILKIKN